MTGEAREEDIRRWVAEHTEQARRFDIAANLSSWDAATIGSEEALRISAERKVALRRFYSDRDEAAIVRGFVEADRVRDPILRRELTLIDLRFAENQLEPEVIDDLTAREAELEKIFYTFRPEFEGKPASNNELLDVLRDERDSDRRRAAWEASKLIGREIAPRLRELVRRRNDAARSLGFRDFFSMHLLLEELDEDVLFSTLDDFRERSEQAFATIRSDIDSVLAEKYGKLVTELYPWHWADPFSQEAPSVGTVELDPLYEEANLEEIAKRHFESIALPIEDVMARSDLYERPGKDQHAFCTDIDREGDVRILCNLRPTERWMHTLLHELGHAAYDMFNSPALPYMLRCPGHTLLTEAVAMFMGRLTREPNWTEAALGVQLDHATREDIRRQLGWSMLISARWILVMVNFERELYRNPDRADLNSLWWDLVERFQLVKRPSGRDEPDWAAKIHLSLAPVYYHNYLLGEFTASQFAAAIRAESGEAVSPSDPAIGNFLRRLFSIGASLHWNDTIAKMTASPLSSRFFVDDFVIPATA